METAVDGRVGGELCSGGHTREYGGGWVKSYSDRVRTRTGGGRVLTSCVGGSRDGVGAGVGVLLAGAFRRLGLPPKGANIVVAESDISMPPEQRDFRGIIGKQSSSELQIKGGALSFRPCGAKLADAMQYVCTAEVWNTAYSRALLTEATSCSLFARASACPAQIVNPLSKVCMGCEDLLL